jgi:nitrogen regulatory protein PII
MSMILFVLHDPEKLEPLLGAWERAGVSGVTVFKSTGIGRIRRDRALREDLPLMPDIEDFFPDPEHVGRTIFTITDDEAIVAAIVSATERVVGNLTDPGIGILVVIPTTGIYGLRKG